MNPVATAPGRRLTTRRFRSRISRTMLFVLLPIAVLPVLLMGGITYARAREMLRQQVASSLEATLETQANRIDEWIRRKHLRLDLAVRHKKAEAAIDALTSPGIVDRTTFERNRTQLLETLRYGTQRDSQLIFNQFLLIDSAGVVQVASQAEWQGVDLSGHPTYQRLYGQPRSETAFGLDPLYQEEIVTLTGYPIVDDQGRLLATVVGVTEPINMLGMLKDSPISLPAVTAHFVTGDGAFIGINPYRKELSPLTPSDAQLAIAATLPEANQPTEGSGTAQNTVELSASGDQPVVASYTWLPSANVGLGLQVPQAEVFGQLNTLTIFTVTLLAGLVMVVALVTWFGTRRLVTPLLELTGVIRTFAEGDWSQRARSRRDDEIGLLANTFNHMAEQLAGLYESIEEQVAERSRQIRTAAEVARIATSTTRLEELLSRTVHLIVERFGYHQASVYLLDDTSQHASLRQTTTGPNGGQKPSQVAVDSETTIGWVIANNEPRVRSRTDGEGASPLPGLDSNAQAEAVLPVSMGDQVLGVLEVESQDPLAFDPESIAVLQTLSNQIASAIHAVHQLESAQVDLRMTGILARSSREITAAESNAQVVQALSATLEHLPYNAVLFQAQPGGFRLLADNMPREAEILDWLPLAQDTLALYVSPAAPLVISSPADAASLPPELQRLGDELRAPHTALIPVYQSGKLTMLLVLGTHEQKALSKAALQPYIGIAELVTTALDKISAREDTQRRMHELQALETISQSIAAETGLADLYEKIFHQVQGLMGQVDFLIALYDVNTRQVAIPYVNEGGQVLHVDPFPLGEGLTSLVIRTRRPLLLVEDTERRAQAMGARVVGAAAKSWLGVPLMVADQVIGVLAVQDTTREGRFNDQDLRLLSTLSAQFAVSIRNARLLEESQQRAVELEIASQISRDISQTLDLDELLKKAINLVRDRFDFYHASVFLLDSDGKYAVVRQSTGEVGQEMIASGHKLAVGSKSIIGYVTANAEPLVVNEVASDPTHRPHPLLPETCAELGIPLRVGGRVLGALDVQSTQAYAFRPDHISVLQLLADQLGVAVANAELFSEIQEHLAQHRLLHHVTTAAASSTSVEDALASAAQGLHATLGGDRVRILLSDSEHKTLELKAIAGFDDPKGLQTRLPFGEGIQGRAAAGRQAVRMDTPAPSTGGDAPGPQSVLAVPLIYRSELLGVLSVESDRPLAYDANDQEMLATLSGTLAAIIANTRLVERQRLLLDVTTKIRRSASIQTILDTTVRELSQALGARRARIDLRQSPKAPEPDNGRGADGDIPAGE